MATHELFIKVRSKGNRIILNRYNYYINIELCEIITKSDDRMDFETAIYTQLNASWNGTVITKPTFVVGGPIVTNEIGTLYIVEDEDSEYDLLTLDSADTLIRTATLSINTTSDANAKNYLAEIRRILNAYTPSEEDWHVLRAMVRKMHEKRLLQVLVQSKQYGVS